LAARRAAFLLAVVEKCEKYLTNEPSFRLMNVDNVSTYLNKGDFNEPFEFKPVHQICAAYRIPAYPNRGLSALGA
jgi:hypothetical protein